MRKLSVIATLGAIGALALTAQSASANIGQEFGFGSRTGGLAGAGAAWGAEGYFAYANPAALPLVSTDFSVTNREIAAEPGSDGAKVEGQSVAQQSLSRLRFSYSLIYVKPTFLNIDNVLVENTYTSDKQRTAGVDTNYRETFGQILGLSYLVDPDLGNLTLGIVAYLPFEQLAYFDTGETYEPEYFMYRARTQRPQFELATGAELGAGFKLGVGVHVAYSLTSNATVFLQSGSGASSMRFSGSMKPKAVPYFGIHYSNPKPSNFAAGVVVRLPATSSNSMVVNTGAHIFPNLRGLDFNFTASSALFYDPLTVETGISWEVIRGARTYLQADYEAWSKFKSPAIMIDDVELTGRTDNTGVVPNPGNVPDYPFRNTVVPRIGEEINLTENTVLRLGYSYHPGVIGTLPTDVGNYLDPNKHQVTLGLGFGFKRFLSWNTPCTIDIHGLYEKLQNAHVDKTPGNEGGDTSDSKIGSPGYDVGGHVLGTGVTLSLAL